MSNAPATPILPVTDLDDASGFYRRLGFDVDAYDSGYAWVLHDGRELLHLRLAPGLTAAANEAGAYLHAENVDALRDAWQQAGVAVGDLAAQPWGMREFSITDPSGNVVRVGTAC